MLVIFKDMDKGYKTIYEDKYIFVPDRADYVKLDDVEYRVCNRDIDYRKNTVTLLLVEEDKPFAELDM